MDRLTLALAAGALLAATPLVGHAKEEPYPTKPMRFIVPAAPGSPPDVIARLIGERLSGAVGQPIIVENRPGAIGTIGLHAVARATADGYTIGLISMPYVIAPNLLARVPYDTEKDLAPVTLLNWSYTLLAVATGSPARSVIDLVALAKARPGMLKFSSNGNATPSHLAGELFKRETGVKIVHIPYKGSLAGVTGLLAGDVDLTFGAAGSVSPHLHSGKLRALATAAPQRLAAHPAVPTLVELGYTRLQISDWQGVVAPAATPSAVIQRLHAENAKVLAMPEFRQRLETIGAEVAGAGPKDFAAHIHREIERWGKVVRDAGITAD